MGTTRKFTGQQDYFHSALYSSEAIGIRYYTPTDKGERVTGQFSAVSLFDTSTHGNAVKKLLNTKTRRAQETYK